MANPQIEVVRNPLHPTMPDFLRKGDYLVIAVQDGAIIALAAFQSRADAKSRAGWENRTNRRMGEVRYAAGFWQQHADGTWAVQ